MLVFVLPVGTIYHHYTAMMCTISQYQPTAPPSGARVQSPLNYFMGDTSNQRSKKPDSSHLIMSILDTNKSRMKSLVLTRELCTERIAYILCKTTIIHSLLVTNLRRTNNPVPVFS